MNVYIISNIFRGLHAMAQFYEFHNNAPARFVPYFFQKRTPQDSLIESLKIGLRLYCAQSYGSIPIRSGKVNSHRNNYIRGDTKYQAARLH
jgi:hypothetical protein